MKGSSASRKPTSSNKPRCGPGNASRGTNKPRSGPGNACNGSQGADDSSGQHIVVTSRKSAVTHVSRLYSPQSQGTSLAAVEPVKACVDAAFPSLGRPQLTFCRPPAPSPAHTSQLPMDQLLMYRQHPRKTPPCDLIASDGLGPQRHGQLYPRKKPSLQSWEGAVV